MRKIILIGLVVGLMLSLGVSWAQKDKDEEPTSWLYFSIVKDDNGKPVRNAAVILHPVSEKGKQERGGIELKSSPEGKCDFDGVPYGTLRVQVLAHGYQTYGEDFEISKAKTDITIKLKRPQGQFSIYDDQAKNPTPRQETAPDDSKDKKPN